MAHLYSNENFPLPVVQELRNLGHDVLTVREAGNADQAIPDDEVLAFATAEARVILTLNRRDFIHLHKAQPNHAGIIVCTYDADFIGQAQRIHEAIEDEATLDGKLLRVNRPAK
jgi:hypothetical protein